MSALMSDSAPASKSKAQVFAARLFSTLLLWLVVTAVFLSGSPWVFLAVTTILGMLGIREYFCMTREGGMPSMPVWGIIVSLFYLLSLGWCLAREGQYCLDSIQSLDAAFVVVLVMGGFCLQLGRPVDGQKTLIKIAVTTLGFVYIPVMFSFLSRLLFLPASSDPIPGAWLVIWLAAVTKFTDMGAYVTGSLIGKHKMIAHISPKKTWQGFAGGLLFAQLAGCGLFAIMPDKLLVLSGWGWVAGLSLLLALLAVVGDLAESVLKRSIGTKDSGNTLPGIGGTLDLIDSICFTAPVLYFMLKWVVVCC